jgi:hypothetical protein
MGRPMSCGNPVLHLGKVLYYDWHKCEATSAIDADTLVPSPFWLYEQQLQSLCEQLGYNFLPQATK